jgi:hypothetical protein
MHTRSQQKGLHQVCMQSTGDSHHHHQISSSSKAAAAAPHGSGTTTSAVPTLRHRAGFT